MTTVNTVAASGAVDLSQFNGDIESMMMAVNYKRMDLAAQQIQTQYDTVNAQNAQIAKLNTALDALTNFETKISGTDASSTPDHKTYGADGIQDEIAVNDAIADAGIDTGLPSTQGRATQAPDGVSYTTDSSAGVIFTSTNIVSWSTTRGQIDSAIQAVKSAIDSASNTQQTDMLELQNWSNKYSNASDMTTNALKKFDDTTENVIRNM